MFQKTTLLCSWRSQGASSEVLQICLCFPSENSLLKTLCYLTDVLLPINYSPNRLLQSSLGAGGCCCSLSPPKEFNTEGPQAPACTPQYGPMLSSSSFVAFSVSWVHLKSLSAPFSSWCWQMRKGGRKVFSLLEGRSPWQGWQLSRLSLPLALQVLEPRGAQPKQQPGQVAHVVCSARLWVWCSCAAPEGQAQGC